MVHNLKNKTVKGVFWNSIDRFSNQGIQFIFSILIARLLLPSDYGIIAMLSIFMAVAQTFISSGFSSALIRKLDRTPIDFSTVFYYNIVMATLFYIGIWLASPFIARFYEIPLLDKVTKFVGLNLIISAFSGIQETKLTINIDFKLRAKISVCTTAFSGTIGLTMAYSGYGVWALVFQTLFSNILRTILLWIFVHWRPTWEFSWVSFRELFSFGSKMLASALLDTVYNNIYTIIIGKFFSSTSLGVYSRADSLAQYPSSNVTGVLQQVSFPILSSIQNEDERLANAYKRFISMSAFMIFPLMVGLSAVSAPLIRVVLTDKWEGAIYLLQIICFSMMWYPIHAINLNLLIVKGRSDYFLKLEIMKKILGVAVLCVTIPMGLVAMCYGRIFSSVVSLVLNTYYTDKLINYGFWKQMRDLFPILLQSFIMGALAYLVVQNVDSSVYQLVAGILAGAIYYIVSSYLLKFKELTTIVEIIRRKKK